MMRKLILAAIGAAAVAGSAVAADLPSRAAPVLAAPAPVFTWTGAYLGGQIGYAWTKGDSAIDSVGHSAAGDSFYDTYRLQSNSSGVIAGGHIGYNLQISQWVLGIEGDLDGSSLSKSSNFLAYSNYYQDTINTAAQSSLGVQSSIRGRVGVAFDRVLLYGTGGVAFGGSNSFVSTSYPGCVRTGGNNCLFGVGPFFGHNSFSRTLVGWTAGAGVEYAITNNWLVRAEYRFTQFEHSNNYLTNSYPPAYAGEYVSANWRRNLNENRVQAGLSYKFDPYPATPVVAKY